jgi:hypothetical protein
MLRWVDAQIADGSVVSQRGPARTGAFAALALLALWGLAVTAQTASGRRGLRAGGALTDAGIALLATVLLFFTHPWIPGGAGRTAWVPIFLPLCLLAFLDALVVSRRDAPGAEVSVVRGVAALFAAGALVLGEAWLPAGIAVWLALSPLLLGRTAPVPALRRRLYVLLLLAGVTAVFAPDLAGRLRDLPAAVVFYVGRFGWEVAAFLLVLTAVHGIWKPVSGATARLTT